MVDPLYLLRICWKGQLNSQEHNYEFRSFYFQFLSEQFQLRAVTNSFEFKIFWHGLLILCNPIYPGAELVSTKSQTLSWNPCITLLHCIDLHFCQALKWPDSRCWPFYCNIGCLFSDSYIATHRVMPGLWHYHLGGVPGKRSLVRKWMNCAIVPPNPTQVGELCQFDE